MKNSSDTMIESLLRQSLQEVVVSEHSPMTVEAFFSLSEDFPPFAGHFPGDPIFPAIFQLTIVRLLVEAGVQKRLRPKSVGRIKFSGIIKPKQKICVAVSCNAGGRDIPTTFSFTNQDQRVCSGSASFVTF